MTNPVDFGGRASQAAKIAGPARFSVERCGSGFTGRTFRTRAYEGVHTGVVARNV